MTDFYPAAEVVEIQGRDFFVAPQPRMGPGVYLAGPNETTAAETLGAAGFALPAANVAAIEAVTGCAVIRDTLRNQKTGTTFAAVNCTKGN
jgi:hypothetical protein